MPVAFSRRAPRALGGHHKAAVKVLDGFLFERKISGLDG
jgi:hypothetical protein